jgi:hypothetical protein
VPASSSATNSAAPTAPSKSLFIMDRTPLIH